MKYKNTLLIMTLLTIASPLYSMSRLVSKLGNIIFSKQFAKKALKAIAFDGPFIYAGIRDLRDIRNEEEVTGYSYNTDPAVEEFVKTKIADIGVNPDSIKVRKSSHFSSPFSGVTGIYLPTPMAYNIECALYENDKEILDEETQ